jgi:putative addiction module component (TIGR02574 family)
MKYTLNIDHQNAKAAALVNYLQTLDFIDLEEQNAGFELSQEQKEELDRRVARHQNGESESFTWEEVKAQARAAK